MIWVLISLINIGEGVLEILSPKVLSAGTSTGIASISLYCPIVHYLESGLARH